MRQPFWSTKPCTQNNHNRILPANHLSGFKILSYKCDKCQRLATILNQPPERMTSITSPWPFMKWRIDIVGKIPIAPGQRIYMLILTYYFTKWVKAEAFHQVRDTEVKKFICKFGVLNKIVIDNRP